MNQKGLAPLLIVILIAAAIGGYFIYQNKTNVTPIVQQTPQPSPTSSDETANWKTYTNEEYGYSVQYPNNWIDVGNQEAEWYNDQYFASSKREGLYSIDISIRVLKSVGPQWSSVKDYFEKEIKGKKSRSALKAQIIQLDNVTVDDEEGIRQILETTPGSATEKYYSDNVYVYKNSYVYKITSSGPDKESVEKNGKIFNQILSTFKFTQ